MTETEEKKQYSLNAICIASRLTEKGYDSIKGKMDSLYEKLEKTDPDNARSDEAYDRMSDNYDFISDQIDTNNQILEISDKLGFIKGGHELTEFEPMQIEFTYTKSSGEESTRIVNTSKYDLESFKLYILASEINGDGAIKSFRFDRMSKVIIAGEEIPNFEKYLEGIVNSNLESLLK